MKEKRVLDVANDLCGRKVRVAGTFVAAGVVADVQVHPSEGRAVAFTLRTEAGAVRRLPAGRLGLGDNLVVAHESLIEDVTPPAGAVAARADLLGAEVVTDDGRLLGRVAGIHVSPSDNKVSYKVAPAGAARFFAEPFDMPGHLPHAYSAAAKRLFVSVPPKAEDAQSVDATRFRGASGARWQYAGATNTMSAFVARNGLPLWLALSAFSVGGMLYL